MTHIELPDEEEVTAADWVAGHLIECLYSVTWQKIDEMIVGNSGTPAVFARLWKLIEAEFAAHPRLTNLRLASEIQDALDLIKTGSPEAAIRKQLYLRYRLSLDRITDLEIASHGRRLDARLKDFRHARSRGQLTEHQAWIANGHHGTEETMCIQGICRYRTQPYTDEPRMATVISLDRHRGT